MQSADEDVIEMQINGTQRPTIIIIKNTTKEAKVWVEKNQNEPGSGRNLRGLDCGRSGRSGCQDAIGGQFGELTW